MDKDKSEDMQRQILSTCLLTVVGRRKLRKPLVTKKNPLKWASSTGISNGRESVINSLIFDILNPNCLHFVSFTDHLKGEITQRHIQRAVLGKIKTFQIQ